ncbi:hypothetical protein D9M68_891930 [compost metagenome]
MVKLYFEMMPMPIEPSKPGFQLSFCPPPAIRVIGIPFKAGVLEKEKLLDFPLKVGEATPMLTVLA